MKTSTAKNPITGDLIKSKSPTKNYLDNYDKIFRKKEQNHIDSSSGNTAKQ